MPFLANWKQRSSSSSSSSMEVSRMVTVTILLVTFLNVFPPTDSQVVSRYRLCIPDVFYTLCQQMISDMASQGGRIDCIPGNDKIDCITRVNKGEADIVILEPEELYVAHQFFHDPFFVVSEIRTTARRQGSFRYEPVAIVRRSANIRSLADLAGKRSCHTAFGRTSGWEVPVSRLMQKGNMIKICSSDTTTVERELQAASQFFGAACAPGQWVPDLITDKEYKQRYPNLCQLCRKPAECQDDDRYAGFRGSLRCLTENNGDVAWTKLETVYQFFANQGGSNGANNNPGGVTITPLGGSGSSTGRSNAVAATISEYAFLCPDGSQTPINSQQPCTWAGRPWKAFIASTRLVSPGIIADLQQQITLHRQIGISIRSTLPPAQLTWVSEILEFLPNENEIEFPVPAEIAPSVTPLVYLERGNYTLTIEKPSCPNTRTIRFCVRSDAEKQKCQGLRMAAIGRRIAPPIDCVLGENRDDCMTKIVTGQADVMTVDAKQAYIGSKRYRLNPILSEAERFGDEEQDAARYTVAVTRADSGIQYIRDLQGKRSCHGSVSSLTGWNIPLIVLRDSSLIYPDCNFGHSIAEFFSSSCIPGANDPELRLPQSLCSLCVGTNLDAPGIANPDSFCANNELEGFYGDLGAFRCLPVGAADVAFVDHLTPLLNTDGLANATWAAGLLSQNFRLVCPYGPSRSVTEFRQCHWGKIPADKVITSEDKDFYEREDIRLTLLRASQTFHPDQTVFRLFGPFYGIPNLIFKDIATGLTPLTDDFDSSRRIDQYGRYVTSNKDIVYDQQYSNRIIRDIDECNGVLSSRQSTSTTIFTSLLSLTVVFLCSRRIIEV